VFGRARAAAGDAAESESAGESLHVLVVDDDAALRRLVRTSLELDGIAVEEAESAHAAEAALSRCRPSLILLDIGMPGIDGLSYCSYLKAEPQTSSIPVILMSGLGELAEQHALAGGADGFLAKPFSPLELVGLVRRAAAPSSLPVRVPARQASGRHPREDVAALRFLLEGELEQEKLLRSGYRETLAALETVLSRRKAGDAGQAGRVVLYASELTCAVAAELLDDPSLDYGFLLHDIGEIGLPDRILQKPGPLSDAERRTMEGHTLLGEQMFRHVPLLGGAGLEVIRSHHERWDGLGYPDRLKGTGIPQAARIFAVADALDAITSERCYRPASDWPTALRRVSQEAGHQFDPHVVQALEACNEQLQQICGRAVRQECA
jgi:response regulator RpfG family c-di-GMP phosphodiesterase